jgi:hypothetical protein
MILASRLLPFRANPFANIVASAIETLAVISMQFVYPLASGAWREHMFASYLFFGTIETVCTVVIIRQARIGPRLKPQRVRSESPLQTSIECEPRTLLRVTRQEALTQSGPLAKSVQRCRAPRADLPVLA